MSESCSKSYNVTSSTNKEVSALKMTQEEEQEEEPKLSFVTLESDNVTMMINGEPKYSLRLPINIVRKTAEEKKRIVKDKILEGCTTLGVDYVSEENLTNIAKEVVDLLYQRARVNTKNYVDPPAHPTVAEQYGNNYFEFLIDCIKKTVKEESALIRQIMYTTLSPYGNDPINLGVLAPTSTGKTYPIMEASKFTPQGKEVRIVGSMTPKVLIREQGVLVDKNGNPIGKQVRRLRNAIAQARSKKNFEAVDQNQEELAALLEDSAYILDMTGKTLLFLEPPHPELWALLKPILSHDSWEIEHPFVDNIGHGLEVKRVITRGWPACIFCSARNESKWDVWPEIESRFMMASPNMVRPKYQAGNKLIAQRKGLPHGIKQQVIISDTTRELGKQAFQYLKHQVQEYTRTTDSPVWIPCAERIAEILPADKGQDNRTANRFFTILNMVALTKANIRHKLLFDDEELVIATLDDLRETLHVLQNSTGMPPHKLNFYKQYILPLSKSKGGGKLETKEICDFYNANSSKDSKMNSDNLRKNYLAELVKHNYLEQEQDPTTKTTKYLFTPLVDIEEDEENNDSQEAKSTTSQTFGRVFEKLHFSKLLLPENSAGVPQDWLNQEILQLSDRRLTDNPLKILDHKGNDIPIAEFVKHYEAEQRLVDFLKVRRRLVGDQKSEEITKPKGLDVYSTEKNIENDSQNEEKSKTQPKVVEVDELALQEMIDSAMRDKEGNNKGYFTKDDFIYSLIMRPNEGWTEDEAEQTLYALVQEGKLSEFEQGRFKPTI